MTTTSQYVALNRALMWLKNRNSEVRTRETEPQAAGDHGLPSPVKLRPLPPSDWIGEHPQLANIS